MKKIFFIFLSLSFLLKAEQPYHTSAYLPLVGKTTSLLSGSHYSTNHFWNEQGKKLPTYNDFRKNSIYLYLEHAFTLKSSMFMNAAYSQIEESLNGSCQGIEDIEVGAKRLLIEKNAFALTLQASCLIPGGKTKNSLRYGKLGAEAGVLLADAFSLFQQPFWYDLGLFYRTFAGFPSNQIRSHLSIGYFLCEQAYLVGTSQLDYGLGNENYRYKGNNVVLGPNYRLLKVQLDSFIHLYAYVTMTFGAFYHLWGQNSGAGGGFQGGLKLDF